MMDEKPWSPFAEVYDPLMCGSIDRTDAEPHDHGIIRALNATYTPDPALVNDPLNTIFISNIDRNSKDEEVRKVFKEYGPIKNFHRVRDLVTGHSKGYAFVEYGDKYDALTARSRGHKTVLDGKELVVEFELERSLPGWKPRRLGGGFGGRKGSGQLRFGGRERPFRKPLIMGEQDPAFKRSGMDNFDGREVSFEDRPRTSDDRYGGPGRVNRERLRDERYRPREGGERKYRERRHSRDRSRESRHSKDTSRESRHSRDRSRERSESGKHRKHREKQGKY